MTAILLSGLLTGCALSKIESWEGDVGCDAGRDCEVKMGRAELFIETYSMAPLKVASSRTLQTNNSGDRNSLLEYWVRKRALDRQHDVISISVTCGNWAGCIGDAHKTADALLMCIRGEVPCGKIDG